MLITIVIAAFSYRFFGPDLVTSEPVKQKTAQVYEPEVKKSEEPEPVDTVVESEKLNESNNSSEQSSSGPEFEIINSDDVPAVEEIQKMAQPEPVEAEPAVQEPETSFTEEAEPEAEQVVESSDVVDQVQPAVEEIQRTEPIADEPVESQSEPEAEQKSSESTPVNETPEVIESTSAAVVSAEVPTTPEVVELEPEPVQTSEIVEEPQADEPEIEPSEPEPVTEPVIEKTEESKAESEDEVEEEIQTGDFGDQTLMTPLKTGTKGITSEPVPINLDAVAEESLESDALEQLEKSLLDASTDDNSTNEPIIAKQEEAVNEPKTDDFNEAAAEIVESVIDNATSDTLADFKKDQVGDVLTAEEIVEEKEIQKKQLEEISKLMEEKGMGEVDPTEQAKLYLDWRKAAD